MGIGLVSIATSQKKELSGAPLAPGSAVNGTSLDGSGRVVLGNDLGGATAALLSTREIPLSGFSIVLTGVGFVGIGTNAPTHKLDLEKVGLLQLTSSIVQQITTVGSTFNTAAGTTTNTGLRSVADGTRVAGGFNLINVGVMGVAVNGDMNFGIGTSNTSFNGSGFFYQSGNFTTIIEGGPASENIRFGPTNEIFLTANRTTVNGALGVQVSATATFLEIAPCTAASASMRFQPGVVLAVPNDGSFEYNGTNLFFTRAAARETVLTGTSGAAAPGTTAGVAITNFYGTAATNYLGDPNSWASVVIAGTTFKIPLYT